MTEQQPLIPPTWVGMAVGLILGYLLIRYGLGKAVVVSLCGLAGYWYVAFRRGDVDLVDGLSRFQNRERTLR